MIHVRASPYCAENRTLSLVRDAAFTTMIVPDAHPDAAFTTTVATVVSKSRELQIMT